MGRKIYGGWRHLKCKLFFALAQLSMDGQTRSRLIRWGGCKLTGNQISIGEKVSFDTVYPSQIIIHDHVHITAHVTILTHYLDTTKSGIFWLHEGNVEICEGAFIGTGSIITKPCTIGRNAIVAAGSVVTKDIPDDEIWGGNPARFIKKRIIET